MIKKIAAIFFILLVPVLAHAVGTGIEVNLGVDGTCNNNGACEAPGETELNCAADCAASPPSAGGSTITGGYAALSIYNLSVETTTNSARIRWATNRPTLSSVRWGENSDVKDGLQSSILFTKPHAVEIAGLKPGTMYYFTIESRDFFGRSVSIFPTYFFTKFLVDTAYPLSPRNVSTFTNQSGINIYWQNPPDASFAYVRIMRHEDRMRGDPNTGKLIYEGTAEKFLNSDVLPGKKYFYVLFARDTAGRYSPGVGVSAIAYLPIKDAEDILPLPPEVDVAPLLENFFVHQYNQEVSPLIGVVPKPINANDNIIVDTDKKTLPDDWLEVKDSSGRKIGSYLFSFNKDSGRYQTVISPLDAPGNYKITVYRYIDGNITIISEATLSAVSGELPLPPRTQADEIAQVESYAFPWILILILLALIFAIFWLIKRLKNTQKA